MNTPTHMVCGAFLAQALAVTFIKDKPAKIRIVVIAMSALCAGIFSHLLMDLLPHYAWIVYLDWFKPLPFHWLIREAVFGLAVAIPAFLLGGRFWPYVAIGMFGGVYPDMEKILSVDFHVPDKYILFGWHSSHLSNRTAGLPKAVLIGTECLLVLGFLLAMWRTKSRSTNKRVDACVSSGSDAV